MRGRRRKGEGGEKEVEIGGQQKQCACGRNQKSERGGRPHLQLILSTAGEAEILRQICVLSL